MNQVRNKLLILHILFGVYRRSATGIMASFPAEEMGAAYNADVLDQVTARVAMRSP